MSEAMNEAGKQTKQIERAKKTLWEKNYDATVNRTRADRLQSFEWKAVILPLNHCVLDVL
jgi:hypothetical protein